MRDLKTLNEVIDSSVKFFAADKGLNAFSTLLYDYEMPWNNDTANLTEFLEDLYRCRSFDKYAARIVTFGASSIPVNQAKINDVCGAMIAKFYHRWLKEWAVRETEYNPVDNYNMTETMTDDERVTEYGSQNVRTDDLTEIFNATDTETKNLSSAETKNLQELTTPGIINLEERTINGFNTASSNGVNDGTTRTSTTGSNDVRNTGTDTTLDTGTDAFTRQHSTENDGTVTDVKSGSDTETRNYQLTRQGNIGVTTSQQMLQSEIELWKWDFFDNVLFPDMDSVLTLKVY